MAVMLQVCKEQRIGSSQELLAYEGRWLEMQNIEEAAIAEAKPKRKAMPKRKSKFNSQSRSVRCCHRTPMGSVPRRK